MAFTFVTITADYDLANGADPTGAVSFIPSEPMVNDETVVSAAVTRSLNIDGVLRIELAANTDPATTTPSGDDAYYLVEESIGGAVRRFSVTIPHNAGAELDLADLTHTAIDVSAPAASLLTRSLPVVTYPVAGSPGPPGPPGPPGDVGNGITLAAADLRYPHGWAVISQALSSESGSIDATQAFVDAFATGLPVFVPPGTYTVTSWAPPTRSQVIGAGQDNTTIRYAGTGTCATLTNLQRNKFVDLRFLLTNAAGTWFKVDNTFRASWTRCVFQGQHTAVADAYATIAGHVGVWLTGNAGDNLFYDCDFLNLGIGIKTDCIQNGVVGGKFGSNYVGIYGFGGGGMSVNGYVDFVGPAPNPIVSKAVFIDGASGQWWFDQCWFEGATVALQVGNASAGPAQFGMRDSKIAATTTGIDMKYCRNPILTNISFTGDQSNVDTPDPIVVNATNAPEGILWGDSIVTGKAITPSNLPKGWMVHTRSGSTALFKVADEVQFPYQSKLRMARSDGTYADIMIIQGGPQMAFRGPGTGVSAVIHIIDTTNNTLLDIDSVNSAVNYLAITPAITGSGPILAARGTDTNVDLALTAKGTGQVRASAPMFLANATAPATPTGGGVVYVESGSLKYKGSSGTVTVLGPA